MVKSGRCVVTHVWHFSLLPFYILVAKTTFLEGHLPTLSGITIENIQSTVSTKNNTIGHLVSLYLITGLFFLRKKHRET